MSMIGEYLRLAPAELERAVEDPEWAWDFAGQIRDVEEDGESAEHGARHFSTYQTWDLLGYLLRQHTFPVDIVHGEEPFADGEDWGYGPPRFLPPHRAQLAAEALGRLTYDDLIHGVDHRDVQAAKVYPLGWDEPASLEWARDRFEALAAFFEAAATAGDAVLVWLD